MNYTFYFEFFDVVKIPLVIAFTPNYLAPAATTLLSILDNSSSKYVYHVICLLTEELPLELQNELKALNSDRLTFSFINLDGKLKDIYVDERYTVAASYRLLLPDLLPEYDKVMYIDCDVIVRNDLGKLYDETNLNDNYLAGVFEATLDFQEDYVRSIGVEPGQYINSGFLIFNLNKLREDGMVAQFLEAAKVDGLQFPDQDVLNTLCQGKILGLSPIYNSIRTFFLPQYKSKFVQRYSEKEWSLVQEIGNIHYTGGKPWNALVVRFEDWWVYYDRLPNRVQKTMFIQTKIYLMSRIFNVKLFRNLKNNLTAKYREIKYKTN